MPAKSLIAFKKQPLQQLGIDPAFEEAGSGTSCSPAMNSGIEEMYLVLTGTGQLREDDPRQKIEQPAHRARCATKSAV
jgi:uncharacterized cupin superfamily protein